MVDDNPVLFCGRLSEDFDVRIRAVYDDKWKTYDIQVGRNGTDEWATISENRIAADAMLVLEGVLIGAKLVEHR